MLKALSIFQSFFDVSMHVDEMEILDFTENILQISFFDSAIFNLSSSMYIFSSQQSNYTSSNNQNSYRTRNHQSRIAAAGTGNLPGNIRRLRGDTTADARDEGTGIYACTRGESASAGDERAGNIAGGSGGLVDERIDVSAGGGYDVAGCWGGLVKKVLG